MLLTQLDAATEREESLREEARNLERSMALLRHELRESQRKSEVEIESRRNLENTMLDLKRKLEEEQSKRTREMSNNQQTNDKISHLEKQVHKFCQLCLIHNMFIYGCITRYAYTICLLNFMSSW